MRDTIETNRIMTRMERITALTAELRDLHGDEQAMKTRFVRECPQCHSTDLQPVAEQLQCSTCQTMAYPHHCWVEKPIAEIKEGEILDAAKQADADRRMAEHFGVKVEDLDEYDSRIGTSIRDLALHNMEKWGEW